MGFQELLTEEQLTELRDIAIDDVADPVIVRGSKIHDNCVERWAGEIVAREFNADGELDAELVEDLVTEVECAIYGIYAWEYAKIMAREGRRK